MMRVEEKRSMEEREEERMDITQENNEINDGTNQI